MPVQQISVATAGRETSSNGKSAPRSKLDKHEGGKATGKTGSRSSNVSKASNSAKAASQTPAIPSPQDTCSPVQLTPLEQNTSAKVQTSPKRQVPPTTAKATGGGPSDPQTTPQKRQVKRRHHHQHRKTSSSASSSNVDSISAPPPPQGSDGHSPEAQRSTEQKKKMRVVRTPGGTRRERPLPCRAARDWEEEPTSSSEAGDRDGGEAWAEARSWSKEKAQRHSQGGRGAGDDKVNDEVLDEVKDQAVMDEVTRDPVMELRSVSSQEGNEEEEKKNQDPLQEEEEEDRQQEEEQVEKEGLKQRGSASSRESSSGKRGGGGGSAQRAAAEEREHRAEGRQCSTSWSASSPSPPPAEEGEEELITKRYQETGAGDGDMSAPGTQNHDNNRVHFGGENGGTTFPCSDDSEVEVCKICHCEGEEDYPLITPCHCTGSLRFVHQDCLNQWIKSSDTRCCELCKYDFIMETQLKPLRKWEKLQMSTSERRKIYCSVLFHLIAIGCVLWSIYVLVKRTADEIRMGRNGVLDWPFWTKLIVVAIGFTSGLIFMYIQCKVYLALWRRLKAFNRIITVRNCPPRVQPSSNGKHSAHDSAAVEVPLTPVPIPIPDPQTTTDSDCSVEAAVAPAQTPV